MNQHTPTPWGISKDDHGEISDGSYISSLDSLSKEFTPAFSLFKPVGSWNYVANMEFVVRAVNCHDVLVSALKKAFDTAMSFSQKTTGPASLAWFRQAKEFHGALEKAGAV